MPVARSSRSRRRSAQGPTGGTVAPPNLEELSGNAAVQQDLQAALGTSEVVTGDELTLLGELVDLGVADGGVPGLAGDDIDAGQTLTEGVEGFEGFDRMGSWGGDAIEQALAGAAVEGNQQTGPDSSWTGDGSKSAGDQFQYGYNNPGDQSLSAATKDVGNLSGLLLAGAAAAGLVAAAAGGAAVSPVLLAAGAVAGAGSAVNSILENTGADDKIIDAIAAWANDEDEAFDEAAAVYDEAQEEGIEFSDEEAEAVAGGDSDEDAGIEFSDEEAEAAAGSAEDQLEGGMSPEEWLDFTSGLDGVYLSNKLGEGAGSGETQPDDLGGALDGELPTDALAMIDDECSNIVIMGVNSEQEANRTVEAPIGTLVQ